MATVSKRAYKACESCRKNKSKCELLPNTASCTKCSREDRQCVFPAERYSKRVKLTGTNSARIATTQGDASAPSCIQLSPTLPQSFRRQDQEFQASTNVVHDVLNTVVNKSSDAIGLLYKVAVQHDPDSAEEQTDIGEEPRDEPQDNAHTMPSPGLPSDETIALWEQHRFVRQGWFTSYEAISYIEFFFRRLSSLSPAADLYYADHQNHKRLILEEPLLCCTLLMISSRYHVPARASGDGRARSDFVHMRMWRHIEHLIQRITFGSEKYSLAKTRTMGSIQALLLITEWHPRALHFPPEGDGWDASLAPSLEDAHQENPSSEATKNWREDVFEPAKRSERMSWTLVGLATTLAHELGVFEVGSDGESTQILQSRLRTRRLLYLYSTQLSLRSGCSNIFPYESHQDILQEDNRDQDPASRERETIATQWIGITKLLMTASETLFGSNIAGRHKFQRSHYTTLLDHFGPLLIQWRRNFDTMFCTTISEASRQILLVEYYFVRMYVYSIAVQALVERASRSSSATVLSFQNLLRSTSGRDFGYISEVRVACVEIMKLATKLSNQSILRHCPVRVFLRIVVASVYLLKTISLGSRETDAHDSLLHLQSCIEAMQNASTDDIHLSSRYATLIGRHVRHFRRNLRVQKPPPSLSRAASRGPDLDNAHISQQSDSPQYFSQDRQQDRQRDQQHNEQLFQQQDQQRGQSQTTEQRQNHTPHPVDNSFSTFSAMAGNSGATAAAVGYNDEGSMGEDWLAQPFDIQFAPFGTDGIQPVSGLAIDSLDFLWGMSD